MLPLGCFVQFCQCIVTLPNPLIVAMWLCNCGNVPAVASIGRQRATGLLKGAPQPLHRLCGAMEVLCPPAIAADIHGQLVRQNAAQRGAFSDLVAEYSTVLTRSRELQARGRVWQDVDGGARCLSQPVARQPHTTLLASPCSQVRCAQLDKEASELRLENETLLRTVEDGKQAAVQSAQVRRCRRRLLASPRPLCSCPICSAPPNSIAAVRGAGGAGAGAAG